MEPLAPSAMPGGSEPLETLQEVMPLMPTTAVPAGAAMA
jgi:hypothetical protein